MKLYIQKDLKWSADLSAAIHGDQVIQNVIGNLQEMQSLAKRFVIRSTFEITDRHAEVTIYAQKCNLDDIAMNELFEDFLTDLFEIDIARANNGGAGCEFAISIQAAQPRNLWAED